MSRRLATPQPCHLASCSPSFQLLAFVFKSPHTHTHSLSLSLASFLLFVICSSRATNNRSPLYLLLPHMILDQRALVLSASLPSSSELMHGPFVHRTISIAHQIKIETSRSSGGRPGITVTNVESAASPTTGTSVRVFPRVFLMTAVTLASTSHNRPLTCTMQDDSGLLVTQWTPHLPPSFSLSSFSDNVSWP